MGSDVDAVNLALLILRVAFGLMMVAHGYNKVKGGLSGTAGWFESMGMKPGKLHAPLAAGTEIGTGLMFAAGFLTPLAASGIIALMIVAHVVAHRHNGFFIFNPGQGWEYVAMIGVAAFAVAAIGAGRWSIDHALGIEWNGWTGFIISLVVGVAGAAGLLAVFYRPTPTTN